MNQTWISVSVKMPKEGEEVLCYCPDKSAPHGHFIVACRIQDKWQDGYSAAVSSISHWMKLPMEPSS